MDIDGRSPVVGKQVAGLHDSPDQRSPRADRAKRQGRPVSLRSQGAMGQLGKLHSNKLSRELDLTAWAAGPPTPSRAAGGETEATTEPPCCVD